MKNSDTKYVFVAQVGIKDKTTKKKINVALSYIYKIAPSISIYPFLWYGSPEAGWFNNNSLLIMTYGKIKDDLRHLFVETRKGFFLKDTIV